MCIVDRKSELQNHKGRAKLVPFIIYFFDSHRRNLVFCLIFSNSQLHNGHQLAEWCMNHLCVNYNKLCRMSPRSLRLLHPDNQAYLVEHRWPPVWYLKDYDYYQKCLAERDKELKPTIKSTSGCLCFSRKSESDPALSSSQL